ncbi:MAG: extracellular solute-binding protein [Lachnospiraceae bacterium]|jgi:putative aldouronate transport system substrate-binding protein|nr:extracellular solute-binding protein [Lachnospiraceae bacterium]
MKKKLLATLLAAAMIVCSLSGCGSGNKEGTSAGESAGTQTDEPSQAAQDGGAGQDGNSDMAADAAKYFDADGKITGPISEEPVTYTMVYRKPDLDVGTIDDKYEAFFKEAEKMGIKFEVEEVAAADWNEKMNVRFAAGDLPDLIWGSIPGLSNYTDQVLDITDYVENYAPTVWDFYTRQPEYYAGESIGGRLYSLACIRQNPNEAHVFVMAMNRVWLEKVGREVPTNLEEFTETIRAFVNEDPNGNGIADEIGIGFQSGYNDNSQNSQTLDFLRVFFGLINDGQNYYEDDIMVEDGKVFYVPSDERYYDMLVWLHDLYEEGLIDRDGFTQTNSDYKQKGADNRYGFVFGGCYISDSGVADGPDGEFDYFIPIQDAKGEITIPILQTPADFIRHCFTINKNCKEPEKLIMLVEHFDESEDLMSNLWYGVQGEKELLEDTGRQVQDTNVGWWWTDDNGTMRRESNQNYFPQDAGYTNYSSWRQTHTLDQPPFILSTAWDDNRILSDSIQRQYARDEIYTPYYYDEMFPYGEMSLELTTRRSEIRTELVKYAESFFSDSVINGIDENKWAAHLENLKRLSIDEYVEGYQQEYEYLKGIQ